MTKFLWPVLAACVALFSFDVHAAELTPRDLSKNEQAAIAGGVGFLVQNSSATIKWLPLFVSGESPQATAYCGVVNSFYLFEADVTIRDGQVAEVGQIRLAVQGKDDQRRDIERRCAEAGYDKELGSDFLPPAGGD